MKTNPVVLALACLWAISRLASAQVIPDLPAEAGKGRQAIEALLQATGLEVAGSPTSSTSGSGVAFPQSFLVRWDSGRDTAEAWAALPENARIPGGRFTLADQQPAAGSAQRQRFPELSPDRLVVALVGGSQQLLAWDVIPDPRLLRAELPDALGELRHRRFYRSTAQLWAHLDLSAEAAELHLYQPLWQGDGFVLEPLATLALPAGGRR